MELQQFLQQKQISEELQNVMLDLAEITKKIKQEIKKYNKEQSTTQNVSGDTQMQLDKRSDEIAFEALKNKNNIYHYASEEQDELQLINETAKYSVALDPLDGSSLIDVNLAIGTVAGIHEGPITIEKRNIIAAVYMVYGPLTTLVIAPGRGKGVHEFMLTENNEFILVKENLKMKEKGKIYSPGGGRESWLEQHKKYMQTFEQEEYRIRFSGCLVADTNQILLKGGGIFTYPSTTKDPQGKLRVLYELEPLTFMLEEAGGRGSDGKQSFINKPVTNIHQKSPAYLGSKYEIELAEKMLNQ